MLEDLVEFIKSKDEASFTMKTTQEESAEETAEEPPLRVAIPDEPGRNAVISALLNALQLDPNDKLEQEELNDCPICNQKCDKYESKHRLFMCCAKTICKDCDSNAKRNRIIINCPICDKEIPKSSLENLKLIQNYALNGKAWAQYNLALYYDNFRMDISHDSIKKNDIEAFQLYLKAAKQGI